MNEVKFKMTCQTYIEGKLAYLNEEFIGELQKIENGFCYVLWDGNLLKINESEIVTNIKPMVDYFKGNGA
jgi:hypothetical protein